MQKVKSHAGKPHRRLKLLPARLKALRLHGKYMGYSRNLKPKQKAVVRALRAKKGVMAAIKRARKSRCGVLVLNGTRGRAGRRRP